MTITLLVNYDLPALLALNVLIPLLKKHKVHIFYTQKTTRNTSLELAELSEFDRQSIKNQSSLLSFDELGAERLNQINSADFDRFARSNPDLVISIRHMSILKSKVIATPTLGIINLHSGPLPIYQGVMATFWAMLNNEPNLGTTLHFIEDSNIDTGSIIATSHSKTNYQQSYLWNVLNLYEAGCLNVINAVEKLSSGQPLTSTPQHGQSTYYSFPTAEDIARLPCSLFNNKDTVSDFI